MLSTANATTTVNPYLESLQSLFEGKRASLDWLVLAHNDPVMVRRVSDVLDDQSSALLQIPQNDWNFDGEQLSHVINWSVREAGIQHLLLLGHSEACPPEQAASWIGDGFEPSGSQPQPESSHANRLASGVQRVCEQTERSKRYFQDQVVQLLNMDEIQQAVSLGKLQIHTLFYMAQSGTFLVYRLSEQAFEPIVIEGSESP